MDSILNNYTLEECNFKFSNLFDTLLISFSISDTITPLHYELSSNRFLRLKEKRIKVLNDEDFFLSEKKANWAINRDPKNIKFTLSIPDLKVLNIWRYPPFK